MSPSPQAPSVPQFLNSLDNKTNFSLEKLAIPNFLCTFATERDAMSAALSSIINIKLP